MQTMLALVGTGKKEKKSWQLAEAQLVDQSFNDTKFQFSNL
jgi:hypothetical protein